MPPGRKYDCANFACPSAAAFVKPITVDSGVLKLGVAFCEWAHPTAKPINTIAAVHCVFMFISLLCVIGQLRSEDKLRGRAEKFIQFCGKRAGRGCEPQGRAVQVTILQAAKGGPQRSVNEVEVRRWRHGRAGAD